MAVEVVRGNFSSPSVQEKLSSEVVDLVPDDDSPRSDIQVVFCTDPISLVEKTDVHREDPFKVVEVFDTEPAMEELDFFLRKLELELGTTKDLCFNSENGTFFEKSVVGIEPFDLQVRHREVPPEVYGRDFRLFRKTTAAVTEWIVPARMHVLGHDSEVGILNNGNRGNETILFADVVLTAGVGSRVRTYKPDSVLFKLRRNQYEQRLGDLEHLSKVDATLNNLRVDVEDYFEGEGNHQFERIEDTPLFDTAV